MSVSEQGRNLALFFIIGLLIGFLFDIFKGFRKVFKIPNLLVDLQDILFLMISGWMYFRSILLFNHGNLRFYLILATGMRNRNLCFDIIRKLCYNDGSNF